MDLSKLTQAEKVIAGSGLALFLLSFFAWFGVGADGESFSHNAWDNGLSLLGVLVGTAMVLQIVLSRFTSVKLPQVKASWGQVHLMAGLLCAGLILLQIVIGDEVAAFGLRLELDRKAGAFLGFLAAAVLAYGGYLRSKETEGAGS